MASSWIIAVVALFSLAIFVDASHFRYGTIKWSKTPGNAKLVNFELSMAFRRSYFSQQNPGQNVGAVGTMYVNNAAISNIAFTINSIDAANDISYATGTFQRTLTGAGDHSVEFRSNARIGSLKNNANGNFNFGTIVRLSAAEVNGGAVNNSPVSTTLPIINIPYNVVPYSYQILASDPENNPLTFRMATTTEVQGTHPTGLTVSTSGLVTINSALAIGLWCTQQVITDSFGNSIAVDYILNVIQAPNYCTGDCGNAVMPPCGTASDCNQCSPDTHTGYTGAVQCKKPLPEVFTVETSANPGAPKSTNKPAPVNGGSVETEAGQTLVINIVADDVYFYEAISPVVISFASIPTRSSLSSQTSCNSGSGCSCVGCNSQPQLITLTYNPIEADVGPHPVCLGVTSMGVPLPYTQHCFTINVKSGQVCGNGIVEGTEVCDGGDCCSSTCTFSSSSTTCRSSNGPCDEAETCSGSSSSCPSDSFKSGSTVCRASAGPCDVAESCTGNSASCPSDSFSGSSVTCRVANGVCDVAESCSGNSASCPSDSFAGSSVTCRASAGICDVAETCTGNSGSCPSDSFKSSSTVCRASVGPCDKDEKCTGSSATCPFDINGSFETACPGLALQGTAFTYYEVIAFGDFTADTGDVEKRLAVGGNFRAGNGWSVGYEILPTEGHVAHSLVVNGDATFGSGAVYPDGRPFPYNAPQEDMFIGGQFNGPSYLSERIAARCPGNTAGCLSSQFSAAKSCYNGYQNALAANSDNVNHVIQWSGLYLTCQDPTASQYYLTLTPSEMTSYTWVSVDSCNSNAKWVINIIGTQDVKFQGGSFPAAANKVIYNVVGSGRKITIENYLVQGSILAPNNNVYEPSGVIVGKVIANNIVSKQINKYECNA